MRDWRAIGKMLLDIHMLVFNCGRSDFRTKHSVAVNLISQSTLAVGSNTHATMAKEIGTAMLDSTAALVAMLGIVRLIEQAGGQAEHIPERTAVGDRLAELAQPGDRIVIMGARDDTLSGFARDLFDRLA